ncbi:hypothetical protein BKA70DRAFT_176335 [Coprinopsis sp. MPI-PUGE-AT-0042]|nr:hypothetical protein BKA70DRAFT_176335 [Coprinopsis sp. MPI-PUGE-AT-0042]
MATSTTTTIFTPTPDDVFAVRRTLLNFLPAELVIDIVEHAEYWPKLSSTREAFSGPSSVSVGRDLGWCYLLSPALPSHPDVRVKPRRVAFNIECVSQCTYDSICSDYTLFEAAIIKPTDVSQNITPDPLEEHPERQIHSWNITNPTRWLIHDVPSTWKEGDRHKVVLDGQSSQEEEAAKAGSPLLLESLAPGDRVAVMVRGLIPGWMNCIYTITTDIHYSI